MPGPSVHDLARRAEESQVLADRRRYERAEFRDYVMRGLVLGLAVAAVLLVLVLVFAAFGPRPS